MREKGSGNRGSFFLFYALKLFKIHYHMQEPYGIRAEACNFAGKNFILSPRFIYTHQILVYNQGGEDEVL